MLVPRFLVFGKGILILILQRYREDPRDLPHRRAFHFFLHLLCPFFSSSLSPFSSVPSFPSFVPSLSTSSRLSSSPLSGHYLAALTQIGIDSFRKLQSSPGPSPQPNSPSSMGHAALFLQATSSGGQASSGHVQSNSGAPWTSSCPAERAFQPSPPSPAYHPGGLLTKVRLQVRPAPTAGLLPDTTTGSCSGEAWHWDTKISKRGTGPRASAVRTTRVPL